MLQIGFSTAIPLATTAQSPAPVAAVLDANLSMQLTTPKSICIFLPTWVGDACMATPMLRSLRAAFPQDRLVGVMRPVIRDVLDGGWKGGQPWFDEIVLLNKKTSAGCVTKFTLIGALRRRKIDVAILLTNSLWSAAVARVSSIPRILGYDRDARGWLLSDAIPVARDGKKLKPVSQIEYYLELARWLGCDTVDRSMQLDVSPSDRELADNLWAQLSFDRIRPTIAINVGAATSATRLWPASKVSELSLRIAEELGWQVLLHCGPSERAAMNQLAVDLKHPKIGSMGVSAELPIGLSKAVLERCDGLVSTDSGPRHLAVALNRSVVSLYGPTDAAWTTTYNRPEIAIAEELACRACYQSPCPLKHHRCMQDIQVSRVLEAISKIGAVQRSAA